MTRPQKTPSPERVIRNCTTLPELKNTNYPQIILYALKAAGYRIVRGKHPDTKYLGAAMMVIEEIAAHAQSTTASNGRTMLNDVFQIAHAARRPSCMPKHPEWGDAIKEAMKSERRAKR